MYEDGVVQLGMWYGSQPPALLEMSRIQREPELGERDDRFEMLTVSLLSVINQMNKHSLTVNPASSAGMTVKATHDRAVGWLREFCRPGTPSWERLTSETQSTVIITLTIE